MSDARILWRRLDMPGHEACRMWQDEAGWHLSGAAVFREAGRILCLNYRVTCDTSWRSLSAEVQGWSGDMPVNLHLTRTGEGWAVNGDIVVALSPCEDIDLGFTPSTNTSAIRRLDLGLGARADAVAAWLDTDDWKVKPLHQGYTRLSEQLYRYRSPMHDYEADLLTDPLGLVITYPELWQAERDL